VLSVCQINVSAALKVHMSEDAHVAVMAFPEFITEPRGEIRVKVEHLFRICCTGGSK